jgi:hypothetical protein
MAIFNNSDFFDAHGSIGNITLRKVNGQIIVSRKISHNPSNTPAQAARRNSFKQMAKLGKSLKPIIDIGFDPVAHGNKYNHFSKENKALADYMSQNDLSDYDPLPIAMLYKILTDKTFTGQVIAAKGTLQMRSEFTLTPAQQLNALLTLTRPFAAGDNITIALPLIIKINTQLIETIHLETHTLNIEEINTLPSPTQLIINQKTHPTLNLKTLSQKPAIIYGVITTAILHTTKERTTSTFTPLPTNPLS